MNASNVTSNTNTDTSQQSDTTNINVVTRYLHYTWGHEQDESFDGMTVSWFLVALVLVGCLVCFMSPQIYDPWWYRANTCNSCNHQIIIVTSHEDDDIPNARQICLDKRGNQQPEASQLLRY